MHLCLSQNVALVRVRTSDGVEGIGEADASPEVVKAIVDAPFSHNIACGLREILIGENALQEPFRPDDVGWLRLVARPLARSHPRR